MGGGGLPDRKTWPHFYEAWSPAGGHWPDPVGWRRNTAIAMGGILIGAYFVWSYSKEREVRSNPPRGGMWIPSQMWYTPGKQIPTQEYMDSKEYTKLPWEK